MIQQGQVFKLKANGDVLTENSPSVPQSPRSHSVMEPPVARIKANHPATSKVNTTTVTRTNATPRSNTDREGKS